MTAKTKWIVGALGAVIVLVLAASLVQVPMGPSASEMRASIDRSLPIGSSRDRVVEFAKDQGMERSSYLERERMISAIRRGVSKGLLSETSDYVRFYFDEKGALQRYTVEEVSTSL
jgi:hypothetical protein